MDAAGVAELQYWVKLSHLAILTAVAEIPNNAALDDADMAFSRVFKVLDKVSRESARALSCV